MSKRLHPKCSLSAVFMTALVLSPLVAGAHDRSEGTLYTLSNAKEGNRVLSFTQDEDGKLTPGASYATGGTGSGGGLGNQGALTSDGEFLIAVNPGSNDVSVFTFGKQGLRLVDRIASGGIRPVSVTMDRGLVYVVNGGSDNIAGFEMSHNGRLTALLGSERGLSSTGTAPAQIQFSHDGRSLIVTEKNTNKIDTFSLNHRGVPDEHHVMTSAAATPFGFAVTRNNLVLVSEAAGGAPNASAVSSYRLKHDGVIEVIDPAVGTTQSAACWVVITQNGRLAFASNTGSGTVSSYFVRRDGDLILHSAIAGLTGGANSAPTDMVLSDDDDFLNVLNSGAHSIVTFKVSRHGDLEPVGETKGLPAAATGLIAP
jgi:6-phosphogluconolactonase